jgi:hypothetical protein
MPDALTTKPATPWLRRMLVLLTVGYVGTFAVWTRGARGPGTWCAATVGLGVAVFAGRRTGAPGAVLWGLAVVLASLGGSPASAALGALAALGAFACVAAACVALAGVPAEGGVAPTRQVSASLPLAMLAMACVLTLGPSLYPTASAAAWIARHAAPRDAVAMIASAGALLALTEWTRRSRRLELGVVERTLAARSLQGMIFSFTFFVALLTPPQARSIGRLGLGLASACVVGACVASDAVLVVRLARRATALVVVGGGVALLGALAAQGSSAGWITALTAGAALAIGSSATFVERPLRPEGGAWLDAFARAREDSVRAEPDDAIRAVLLALRAPNGPGQPSPELWTLVPPTLTTVDAAGYVREQTAELPADLVAVVTAEPDGVLRSEVLDALEVRRPDLRPLCSWMAARGCLLAALIAWEGEPEGILVLPRGLRRERVALEELRAMRALADCLAGACRARGAAARMRASLREAALLVNAAETRAQQHGSEHALVAARGAQTEERLARPAEVGVYSAVARMALDALERRLAAGGPVVVLGPSGLDPVAFVARAHLGTARASSPLVVVEGTDPREQNVGRWRDASTSPLALADGGTLAIVDAAALPPDVQATVGRACADRRAPWVGGTRLTVQLVAMTARAPGEGAAFEPDFAGALGSALSDPVVLPRLSERLDDLRSLVIEGLAREGMRAAGRPIGIEPSAYARLVDYEFPGDVAELNVLLQRLVAGCAGDTVRLTDVEVIGLGASNRGSRASGGRVRKDPMSA